MDIKRYLNLKSLLALTGIVGLSFQQVMAQAAGVATDTVSKTDGLGKTVGYYLILFLLICVVIGIIGKVLHVYELTKQIQGKKEGIAWNKVNGILFAVTLVVGLYGAYWCYTVQGAQILPEAASEHGLKIDSMFRITLVITTIVFVITHILLFLFAYKYNYKAKRKAYYYPHNNTLEKYWTVIPAIALTVLVLMGFFTWRGITNISSDQMKSALQVDVTAHQFAWEVRYSGKDNVSGRKNYKLIGSLGGLNSLGLDLADKHNYDDLKVTEIVLPVNKSVRFTLTSQDVLHSFYMPHFRVQMNCVPGMSTFFQFTPRITTAEMKVKTNDPNFKYRLYCAKICGAQHYNMQFAVRVVTQREYDKWVKEQKPIVTDDMKKEYQLAMKENVASKENKIALNN
ncbi:MAG: cytochrome c oxidase subunit II [Bacteroidetes bacterium]|nr:cytochrome c oxidase subunit II [Bacteroidota bacterium]MBU1483446.1 cytochrome c oxidase subunit II [Bacteroidota bacterium]MBU2047156.1 cytochrome c oxidase subunit II [Bacteroidota bacterium]MBU2269208.1 cytochrome c oxidase subunit II [Bacteroidota bacterium]MBU2376663.1 cytochrome c oxidase subunit II [Bacteroidota bacterium]